jgi:hypothetical protein
MLVLLLVISEGINEISSSKCDANLDERAADSNNALPLTTTIAEL